MFKRRELKEIDGKQAEWRFISNGERIYNKIEDTEYRMLSKTIASSGERCTFEECFFYFSRQSWVYFIRTTNKSVKFINNE